MKKYSLLTGLLLGSLLMASQAMALVNAPATITMPPTPDADGTFQIKWAKSTTSGAVSSLEEATLADFSDAAVVYTGTGNYATRVKGTAEATYYYRVRATKAGDLDGPSAYTVGANGVEVANRLSAPTSISAPATDVDGTFTVVVSRLPAGTTYVIEQSVDSGPFAEVYVGTTYYKAIKNGATPATYSYRALARKAGTPDSSPTAAVNVVVSAFTGSTALAAANPTEGAAWATSSHVNLNNLGPSSGSCVACHSPTGEKTASGYGVVSCEACHGIATGGVLPASSIAAFDSCAKCHNSHYSATTSIASDFAASAHGTTPYAPEFGTDKCVVCHDPHTANVPTVAICSTCHSGAHVAHQGTLPDCTSCHDAHSLQGTLAIPSSDLPVKLSAHASAGQVAVSNAAVSTDGTNVTMTFNVKMDGVNADNFTFNPAGWWYKASVDADGLTGTAPNTYSITEDFTRVGVNPTIVSNGSGNYTATWSAIANNTPAGVATLDPKVGNVTYMVSVYNAAANPRLLATAVGYLNGKPRDLVSNDGCIDCHDNNAFSGRAPTAPAIQYVHYGTNPQGAEACVVCHTRGSSVSRGAGGDRTTAYVHGIHNSKKMPSGGYDRQFPVKDGTIDFKVTYPTYMTNCSVCHTTPAQLAAVNAAPVSYSLCMSCHDGWTGFGHALDADTDDHANMTFAEDCSACHAGDTAATMHNFLQTERSGIIYNGQDVSVTEGAKVNMQITGTSRVVNNLIVTWTATYDGNPVNPCNTTVDVGAPIFHAGGVANPATGQVASNINLLRAFGQGDDWVNAGIGTSPGQPVNTNITTSNTVCASNVATTTIPLTASEIASTAVKGVVAIQGKAQVKLGFDYDPVTAGTQDVDQVRSKTPTREFVVATGATPASARRDIVDTAACLKCHVGSLYQHGGNRVDNVDMCVLCHNEASSEQSVRVFDGVDASEAYDGKAGMTYGFKSLLHAVHSAGENGAITMCYRTNGNYVWAGHNTVIPNYPAGDVFADGGIDDNPLLASPVGTGSAAMIYGSSAPHGTGPVVSGPLNAVYRSHNLHVTTYPQAQNNCAACHKPGTFGVPDPTKAVATTLNVGSVAPNQAAATHANYGIQTDDTLQGPAAASCMSCHASSDPVRQAWLTSHANQGGFTPAVLVNGRADVINGAAVENCSRCHQ